MFAVFSEEGDPTFRLTVEEERCGDGARSLAEECDDGNAAAGDGCSPACTLESTEREPNDTFASATPLALGPITRGHAGGGDPDWFRFHALATARYAIELWNGSVGDCQESNLPSLELASPSGATLAAGQGGYGYWGTTGACREILWTAPATGDYGIVVESGGSPYFLQVRSP